MGRVRDIVRGLPPALVALNLFFTACQSQPPASSPPAATTAAAAAQPAPAPNTTSGQGGSVTIGLDQEPPTLDPEASPSAITFYITSSVGETLLYVDENRQIQPWLAQSYEVSDDARSFTFKLRNDVTFQDGTPFNAAAVKWNLDRVVDPNFKAGSALAQLTGYAGTDVVDEFTARALQGRLRPVPHLRGQSVHADAVADCHAEAGRSGQPGTSHERPV